MTSLSTPLDVVYITETIGGVKYSASGILISPDEVLTASHVVYTQGIGTATNIVVTPGGKSALGTYTATDIHYNPVADAGGQISAQSAQSDYAVIHLATPVDGVGYMGLGAGYSLGGAVSDAGFPAPWGPIGENSSGMAVPVTGMSLLQIPYLGEGSSGGPAWIQNSNGTGSVVATVSFSTSYFAASCGGAPLEIIKQYIEQQRTPD